MNILLALVVYPGLALLLLLAVVFRALLERRTPFGPIRLAFNPVALLGYVSIGLAAFALALLPWPLHPAAGWALGGRPALIWAALEGACLLPLLPGLRSKAPFVVRAASREAQMGVAGRVVLWLAVGLALTQTDWALPLLPGRLALLLAGLLAVPVAAGVGMFGPERGFDAAGVEQGLDHATTTLLGFARTVRAAAVLAVVIVASLSSMPTQPPIALVVMLALFVVVTLVLRQTIGLPRMALPHALQWCWRRALPLALVGLIYLSIVAR